MNRYKSQDYGCGLNYHRGAEITVCLFLRRRFNASHGWPYYALLCCLIWQGFSSMEPIMYITSGNESGKIGCSHRAEIVLFTVRPMQTRVTLTSQRGNSRPVKTLGYTWLCLCVLSASASVIVLSYRLLSTMGNINGQGCCLIVLRSASETVFRSYDVWEELMVLPIAIGSCRKMTNIDKIERRDFPPFPAITNQERRWGNGG